MNCNIIYPLFLAAMTFNQASAADFYNINPGTLADAIGADTTATSLKVTGSLNASDFAFIADRMLRLKHIDISGCTIAAYVGAELPFSGLRSTIKAQLPPYSFIGMKNLESVILPQELAAIGSGAFTGSGVRSVSVPEGVTLIDDYAFMRCDSLTAVTLPASLTQLGKSVFANCTLLKNVIFTSGNSLASLPANTFEGCVSLSEVNLDALAKCAEIGPWSLAHCSSLTNVIMPSEVTTIGRGALLNDNAIRTLTLNPDVESFDEYSLAGLRHVTKLSLPKSVTFFATGAMSDWTSLTELNASALNNIPELGDSVWSGIDPSSVTLVVADDLADSFCEKSQWQDFRIVKQSDYAVTTDLSTDFAGLPGISITIDGGILTVKTEKAGLGTVSIFNTSGVRMVTKLAGKEKQTEISVNSLPDGAYLIVTSVGVAKIALFQ